MSRGLGRYIAKRPYPYDPNRAKALFAEAGWKPGPDGVLTKDGKRLSFSLRHDQADQTVKDTAIIIQEFLKKVGVEARIEPLCPTLVMVGRHDWICPVDQAEEIHKLIPQSELTIFEVSGHWPQVEERDAFVRRLKAFLNSPQPRV